MWDWLNCVVLFRHEYGIWCEEGSIFLRCTRCGHRSQGWDVENRTEPTEPKQAPAHAHRRLVIVKRHA
jgi:hypothetical protein